MIYGKSVHTVHFFVLFIIFIVLGSKWFEVRCTQVCTKCDYLSQNVYVGRAGLNDVKLYGALYWQLSALFLSGSCSAKGSLKVGG